MVAPCTPNNFTNGFIVNHCGTNKLLTDNKCSEHLFYMVLRSALIKLTEKMTCCKNIITLAGKLQEIFFVPFHVCFSLRTNDIKKC